MNLMYEVDKLQEKFDEYCRKLKENIDILLKLRKVSRPWVFIGNKNHFHYGELENIKGVNYEVRKMLVYNECGYEKSSEETMTLDTMKCEILDDKIVIKPCSQINVVIPKVEIILRNCVEVSNSQWIGFDKKEVDVFPNDEVLTLPSIAKEIGQNQEYIKKCENLEAYFNKIGFSEIYNRLF